MTGLLWLRAGALAHRDGNGWRTNVPTFFWQKRTRHICDTELLVKLLSWHSVREASGDICVYVGRDSFDHKFSEITLMRVAPRTILIPKTPTFVPLTDLPNLGLKGVFTRQPHSL